MSLSDQNAGINWKAELLRFTGFFPPGFEVNASDWWKTVVGGSPETRSEKPLERQLREQGPLLGGNLALSVTASRVDWLLAGSMSRVTESGSFDALPDLGECVAPFEELVSKWFVLNVPLVRFAWGYMLAGPVDDRETGYRRLAPYLPKLDMDPANAADLSYQVNRPRQSQVISGLRINRLSKWSIAMISFGEVPMQGGHARITGSLHACRLELDINTAAENVDPIPPNRYQPLLGELINIATEISQQGDIR